MPVGRLRAGGGLSGRRRPLGVDFRAKVLARLQIAELDDGRGEDTGQGRVVDGRRHLPRVHLCEASGGCEDKRFFVSGSLARTLDDAGR